MNPITPDEVVIRKAETIPDEVIAAFNDQIAANWNGTSAIVKQKDVAADVASRLNISREMVFKKRYLDVEDIFRSAGWDVYYDKPGFNESYEATFQFSKGAKHGRR